jgi:hypothetical protein
VFIGLPCPKNIAGIRDNLVAIPVFLAVILATD